MNKIKTLSIHEPNKQASKLHRTFWEKNKITVYSSLIIFPIILLITFLLLYIQIPQNLDKKLKLLVSTVNLLSAASFLSLECFLCIIFFQSIESFNTNKNITTIISVIFGFLSLIWITANLYITNDFFVKNEDNFYCLVLVDAAVFSYLTTIFVKYFISFIQNHEKGYEIIKGILLTMFTIISTIVGTLYTLSKIIK